MQFTKQAEIALLSKLVARMAVKQAGQGQRLMRAARSIAGAMQRGKAHQLPHEVMRSPMLDSLDRTIH